MKNSMLSIVCINHIYTSYRKELQSASEEFANVGQNLTPESILEFYGGDAEEDTKIRLGNYTKVCFQQNFWIYVPNCIFSAHSQLHISHLINAD